MIWSTKANCLTTTPEWQKHKTQILSCSECSFILFRYSFPQGTQLVYNVLGEQQMLLHWWNYSPQAVIGLIARNYILFECRWCYHRKYRGALPFVKVSVHVHSPFATISIYGIFTKRLGSSFKSGIWWTPGIVLLEWMSFSTLGVFCAPAWI